MQPMLALSASHPGILYINGHFAGELSHDQPLLRPIGAQGAVYLDYRPLTNACRAMARRLVFSGGTPMIEAIEDAQNLEAVIWPGFVTEIEFSPPADVHASSHIQLAGHDFFLEPDGMRLFKDDQMLCTLPEGAGMPEFRRMQNGCALRGSCADGKYLLTMDEGMNRQTGFLRASQLEIEADERIRAVSHREDLVGHASLEIWRLTPEGLMMISSEPAWAHGAPRWPATPADTARAAVEAALSNMDAEAEGYLSPALRGRVSPADLRGCCDLCVEMRYAPPDPRPCVGLLALEGERIARVRPLYYHAIPSGHSQGQYLIDAMEWN